MPYDFHADRRYVHPANRGHWTASNSAIWFRPDLTILSWGDYLIYARMLFDPFPNQIRFDGPDRFYMSGGEFVRVPDGARPAAARPTAPLE